MANEKFPSADKIIRRKQLRESTGLSPTRVYELVKKGLFPRPIKLTPGPRGAVGWRQSSIDAWLAEREVDTSGDTGKVS